MQIDLANWFEIFAVLIAGLCYFIRPGRCIGVLATLLLLTLIIEFSSKYLYSQFIITQSKPILYFRLSLYSVFINCITVCGNLAIVYYILNDHYNKRLYFILAAISITFVLFNFVLGQGYKQFNNFSTAVCWIVLVAFALYKLRTYNDSAFSKWANFLILFFLLTTIAYYTVNIPFFIFFHSMFSEERKLGIQIYRAINDGANYFLYLALSLFAILSIAKQKNPKFLNRDDPKPTHAI